MSQNPNRSDSQSAPFGLAVRTTQTHSPNGSDYSASRLQPAIIPATTRNHHGHDSQSSRPRLTEELDNSEFKVESTFKSQSMRNLGRNLCAAAPKSEKTEVAL